MALARTSASVLSGHKKRFNRSIELTPHGASSSALRNTCGSVRYCLSQDRLHCQDRRSQRRGANCAHSAPRESAHEFLARHFGLSDVTETSHHWIGGVLPPNHYGLKCFGRIPRRMPFLGAGAAPPCVLGRRVGIFPSLASAAKTGGFLGDETLGDTWWA